MKHETLKELYDCNRNTPSDINEHCSTLFNLAKQHNHITELGTRWGISTSAFLYAQPETLVCYDRAKKRSAVDRLDELSGDTDFSFHTADVLAIELHETDLLFIDTWHAYIQLKQELDLHSDKAKHHIVLHDTVKFARRGDTCKGTRDPQGGLMDALEEFLEVHPEWEIEHHYTNNNGLTVLRRVS